MQAFRFRHPGRLWPSFQYRRALQRFQCSRPRRLSFKSNSSLGQEIQPQHEFHNGDQKESKAVLDGFLGSLTRFRNGKNSEGAQEHQDKNGEVSRERSNLPLPSHWKRHSDRARNNVRRKHIERYKPQSKYPGLQGLVFKNLVPKCWNLLSDCRQLGQNYNLKEQEYWRREEDCVKFACNLTELVLIFFLFSAGPTLMISFTSEGPKNARPFVASVKR